MLAELVFQARDVVAGRVGGHDERAHAALAGALVGHSDDDGDLAVLAAGDELLHAVDHVTVAVLARGGAQARGVAAGLRFGEAEGAEHLALGQRLEPFLLLLRVAVAHEDGVDGAVGHADGGAGAAVAGRNLFEHQCEREVVEARAAMLLGHADAVGAQRGQALVHFLREAVVAVPLGGVGPELGLRKIAHGVADGFLVCAEQHGVVSSSFLSVGARLTCRRPGP
ncbi:hypothetical protein FQZ97_924440 [compost metagenome]